MLDMKKIMCVIVGLPYFLAVTDEALIIGFFLTYAYFGLAYTKTPLLQAVHKVDIKDLVQL